MNYPVIDPVAIGERIKEVRKLRNIRVSDIREFMNFESEQAIYKWQRGESLPTVDNLYALSLFLGVSMEYLICGAEIDRTEREEDEMSSSISLVA